MTVRAFTIILMMIASDPAKANSGEMTIIEKLETLEFVEGGPVRDPVCLYQLLYIVQG
jgi:hypothetical protein